MVEIKDVPIIFITAKTDSESIVEGFICGAVDYVSKPFIRSELLARVNTQIEIKRARDKLKEYLSIIEERNKNITNSIEYACNIQNAVISKSKPVCNLFPEHFILLLPKDIVSGDFYWCAIVDDLIIIAVMDCTGHGVPGALMSILGATLLDEIVKNSRIVRPDEILNQLRNGIISSLRQDGVVRSVKDGLEGSVVCYNQSTGVLQFSGSVNPLIIIHNGDMSEVKADRFPIGYSDSMHHFQLKEIEIKKGDQVYLFTDGFPDQFGGPHSRKFMRKRFMELLQKNHFQPMEIQKKVLFDSFIQWKGDSEQTDDVLVAGFKF